MFDLEAFIGECRKLVSEPHAPAEALKLMRTAMTDPDAIAAAVAPLDPNVGFYVGADKDLNSPTRRALLADLLTRLARAYHWGDEHQAQWIKDVEAETGVDARTATTEVHTGLLEVRFVSPQIIQTEQRLAQTFYEAGQIGRPVSVGPIVDNLLASTFKAG